MTDPKSETPLEYWKGRLAHLLREKSESMSRFDEAIAEARRYLHMHEKHARRQQAGQDKWEARHAAMNPERRVSRWLRRFPYVGPKTAARILTEFGGAQGLWEKVHSGNYSYRLPLPVTDAILAAETPPWDTP